MATATSTAPAPYDGPLPGSGAYGIFQSQAQTAYQNAMAQIQAQRSSLLSQSGMGGTYNADGSFAGLSGPLANAPTGTYQQMMSQNAAAHDSAEAAIHGLGFTGGLAKQAHEQSQLATSQNAANYAQQLAGQLSDLSNQETNQTNNYQQSLVQEMLNEIQSGIANQTFNPGDPGAPGATPNPSAPGGVFTGVKSTNTKIVGRTASGQPIYGYGKNGTPFLNIGQAIIHGRLGTTKPKGGK